MSETRTLTYEADYPTHKKDTMSASIVTDDMSANDAGIRLVKVAGWGAYLHPYEGGDGRTYTCTILITETNANVNTCRRNLMQEKDDWFALQGTVGTITVTKYDRDDYELENVGLVSVSAPTFVTDHNATTQYAILQLTFVQGDTTS